MSFIEFKHIGKKYAGAEHKSVDDFNLKKKNLSHL